MREWLYNSRLEVSGAMIGTTPYAYNYDSIGNCTAASINDVTTTYTANNLNQYTTTLSASESLCSYQYDADGNLISDGVNSYTYDCENNLVSVQPVTPTNGALRVSNTYDHLNRRIRKTVERYEADEWIAEKITTFVYDGWNLLLETTATATGVINTREYFWGPDLSGTEQGSGGVGGLLAVSINGIFYFPCYDHNGNVMCYVSESGAVAATYLYDAFGNIVNQSGALADTFRHRFSTKYFDDETGFYYYGYRYYHTPLGRWLNRDPIEEEGGLNLYSLCKNDPLLKIDKLGENIYLYTGNNSGSWLNDMLHQSVAVDIWSPKGKRARIIGRTSFTFGFNGNWDWYTPRTSWMGFDGFVLPGYFMEGEMEEINPPVGSVVAEKKTTCAEDRAWLRRMRERIGTTDIYSVGRHNCRNFSQSEFNQAPGVRIK